MWRESIFCISGWYFLWYLLFHDGQLHSVVAAGLALWCSCSLSFKKSIKILLIGQLLRGSQWSFVTLLILLLFTGMKNYYCCLLFIFSLSILSAQSLEKEFTWTFFVIFAEKLKLNSFVKIKLLIIENGRISQILELLKGLQEILKKSLNWSSEYGFRLCVWLWQREERKKWVFTFFFSSCKRAVGSQMKIVPNFHLVLIHIEI